MYAGFSGAKAFVVAAKAATAAVLTFAADFEATVCNIDVRIDAKNAVAYADGYEATAAGC